MNKHLKDTNQSYIYHFIFGFTSGITLIIAGVISIIHGLIPDLFPFKAELIISELKRKSEQRRIERNLYAKDQKKEKERSL